MRLGCAGLLAGLLLLGYTGTWALPFTQHGPALIGAWSSNSVVLELTDAGGWYYEGGCTAGRLAGPLLIDAAGTFSTTVAVGHIHPVPPPATPGPSPPGADQVSLRGHVAGAHMDLRIDAGSAAERAATLTFQALYTPPTRCP